MWCQIPKGIKHLSLNRITNEEVLQNIMEKRSIWISVKKRINYDVRYLNNIFEEFSFYDIKKNN